MLDLSLGTIFYGLEERLEKSAFWVYENSPDDLGLNCIPYVGHTYQTTAAEKLQQTIQAHFDSMGERVIIVVVSPEPEKNEKFVLRTSNQDINRLVLGGEMYITNVGRQIIELNLCIFDPEFSIIDIDGTSVATNVTSIVRHEFKHILQIRRRAKASRCGMLRVFKAFRKDLAAIPDEENTKYYSTGFFNKRKYDKDYFSSYLELDAHATQAAYELYRRLGSMTAKRILRLRDPDFGVFGAFPPPAVSDYLVARIPRDDALIKKFKKKVYNNLERLDIGREL